MAQGEKRPVVMEAAKGVPGGVASLGADGKVPQEQLPEFGISNAEIKQKLVDDDCLALTDSEANNRTKRVFWSNIKEILGGLFVPVTRKINNKALSSDVTLTGADIPVSGSDDTPVSTALSNKVNAGAPQVYDLPLSSGWTNYGTSRSRYWRNQFGEVSVIVDISNDGAVQHSSVVAQLPTGFRPAENFDVPAVLYDGNNQTCLKCFVRAASGEIIVASSAQTTWPEATYFIAQLTFMASS